MRKTLILLLVLLIPTVLFASGDSEGEEEITLTVPNDWFFAVDEAYEAFMEAHPNITLQKSTGLQDSQDEAVFATRIAAGDIDDVFGGGDEYPDQYGPDGLYIDLSPYLEEDRDLWYDSDRFMHWWIYENPDGAIYSLPICGNPMVVIYNEDMLDAAGLEYPPERYSDPEYDRWDWGAFRRYAEELTDPGADVYGVGLENNILIYETMIATNGGRLINDDATDYRIDDPAVVETFDYLTSFVLDGLGPNPDAAQESGGVIDMFLNDQIAMIIVGAWNVGGMFHAAELEAGKNIGIATLPYSVNKTGFVLAPAVRVGISTSTEHPDAAYEFLRFLYWETEDIVKGIEEYNPWLSAYARVDVYNDVYAEGRLVLGRYGDDGENVDFLVNDHMSEEMLLQEPAWYGGFFETRDNLLNEMAKVYGGTQSLDEAVSSIDDLNDEVLRRR